MSLGIENKLLIHCNEHQAILNIRISFFSPKLDKNVLIPNIQDYVAKLGGPCGYISVAE